MDELMKKKLKEAEALLCDKIADKESKMKCMFNELYKITEAQDIHNISLIKTLNDDSDQRWKGLHMIDNANAIILGLSRNKCKPSSVVSEGYVGEKVDSLNGRWEDIKRLAREK